jgi:hypothetical protein
MSLARLGRRARLASARLHTAQDPGLVGLAVAGAALVGHIILVWERPQDAGAGAGGGAGRQHGCAGADHPSGNGKGGCCGLPVQHAGHLEQGDREGPERDQPGPSCIWWRINPRSSSACLSLVAMSAPP